MESWLIADIDNLARFYGQGFLRNAIPYNENVENIEKSRIEEALDRATRQTKFKKYHKIHHGPKILAKANVNLVRERAPHCNRLFETLIQKIEES
ncbi:MAG: hypothetical protein OHK0022_46520 [Roseiflexaceae bacterium]